ncbi:carbohydrate kinase family protein [Prosthecomicrobium hirschii]|uniref:carbohydrate kinase family protein n=1 Tax=Prosthecodimorpha hirschii TaxID=665126 RepID=UPI0022211463|nr:carbohydrate kinase family protein [Prosthecomicrobium hirschii]MCW1839900.1 carbohydrate kinase family protein [Prosthecomicrobium hirschii]
MPKVVLYGYLSIDGIVAPGVRSDAVAGGAALYGALGARMAGAEAAIVACRGEDYPAAWIAALAGIGIDVAWIRPAAGPTRRARIRHASDGDRSSSHYGEALWWERTAALRPPVVGPAADIAVLCPMPPVHAAAILAGLDCPAVADTSEAFAAAGPADWPAGGLELLPRLRLFAPSREETALLLPDVADDAAVVALASRGCDIVQKRGSAGLAYCRAGDTRVVAVAPPRATVLDPTGAGDATVGALAARIAAGDTLDAACRVAVRVGAAAVAGIGPSALGLATPPFPSPATTH